MGLTLMSGEVGKLPQRLGACESSSESQYDSVWSIARAGSKGRRGQVTRIDLPTEDSERANKVSGGLERGESMFWDLFSKHQMITGLG